MSLGLPCPYPGCARVLPDPESAGACVCALRQPVARCPRCGMPNRAEAHFCRRCRAGATERMDGHHAGPVELLRMEGEFRRPPVLLHGMAYALDGEGQLQAMPLRAGAQMRTVGGMSPRAASSGMAIADFVGSGGAKRGWHSVGLSALGVEAVRLETGERRLVYESTEVGEIVANEAESASGFRGVCASSQFIAFAERRGDGVVTLLVKRWAGDGPIEPLLSLEGTDAMAPVGAAAADALVLATDEAVGAVDLGTGRTLASRWPQGFKPLFARRLDVLNVAPGCVPLAGASTGEGRCGGRAGVEGRTGGLLAVNLDRQTSRFEALPAESSVSTAAGGGLCVAAGDEVRLVGAARPARQRAALQPGMPAGADGRRVIFFSDERRGAGLRLKLNGWEAGPLSEMAFDDAECRVATCCGVRAGDAEVAVAYFGQPRGSGYQIKLACWSLYGAA